MGDPTREVFIAHRIMRSGGYKNDVLQDAALLRTSAFTTPTEMLSPVQWYF
jgi:hypothetical protein